VLCCGTDSWFAGGVDHKLLCFLNRLFSSASFEEERLIKLEAKSLKLFRFNFSSFEQSAMESELEVVCLEEECKESEADTINLKDNIRKIGLFCTDKGEQELHLRSLLRKKGKRTRCTLGLGGFAGFTVL
jgi:hypothetical protein